MMLTAFKQVKGDNDKFADDHKNVVTAHKALKRGKRRQGTNSMVFAPNLAEVWMPTSR
jgi:hypothetical protein